jgi:exodeoxyribonuclease VII large subunit
MSPDKCGGLIMAQLALSAVGLRAVTKLLDNGGNVSQRVWQVGALCQAVADALDARFNPVTVRGEISGFSRATSGHCYFSIKDDQSQIRCAMFRRAAGLIAFSPRDGDQVEVRGRLGVYSQRGDLQLVVESMSRAGQGVLLEQFLAAKARLETLGLFDAARKRAVPAWPRAVGVVTSLGAAALHDVVTAIRRRAPHVRVVIAPALVQGPTAAADMVSSLERLYALAVGSDGATPAHLIDAILLVRGGGSLEDLWSFNDESLCHCIVRSPVPVISGIGHETDFTLADFCADLRAPTPTAAAELVCTPTQDGLVALEHCQQRMGRSVARQFEARWQRLDLLASRLSRPASVVSVAVSKWNQLQHRLARAVQLTAQQARLNLQSQQQRWGAASQGALVQTAQRLEHIGLRLAYVDPALVLQRGYAWLEDSAGRPVTSATNLAAGQSVQATLKDGVVDLTVNDVKTN